MKPIRDSGRLVVVTAVKTETRAVLAALKRPTRSALPGFRSWECLAGTRSVTLVQAGVGPVRAFAALKAVTVPHDLVVSIGFAGALVAEAAPGDIVLPQTVVWQDGPDQRRYAVPVDAWQTAKTRLPPHLGLRALQGPLLSSPTVVASPEAKRVAALRSGAVAVEMEAAALISVAHRRGIEVLVLRAILDTVDTSLARLPPEIDSSWWARVQLVGRPGAWPGVLVLTRLVPRVARILTEAATAVLAAL